MRLIAPQHRPSAVALLDAACWLNFELHLRNNTRHHTTDVCAFTEPSDTITIR